MGQQTDIMKQIRGADMNKFKVIDMHCDTATGLARFNRPFVENDGHISLRKLQEGNYMMQCFAIFIHKKRDIPNYDKCMEYIHYFKNVLKENAAEITQVTTADDIIFNDQEGRISAMLTIEGGEAIEGSLEKLQKVYDQGVRMMTLTWNFENEIGYPNDVYNPDGPRPDTEHGLKPFGLETINRMQELGMIIDVSHLSDAGIYDVLNYASKPIVASHSNARAIWNCPRNMTDDMIRKLHRNGGIMGMNYCPDFVSGDVTHDQIPDIVRHIRHIADIAGIETVALGSDFDGIETPVGMSDATKTHKLYEALKADGFADEDIDRIFYKNFLRVLKANQV